MSFCFVLKLVFRRRGEKNSRKQSHDAPFLKRPVDDRHLHRLDRDRRLVDPQHARPLARRRAHAPRELREVVRLEQPVERVAPLARRDERVELGHLVAERAARRGLVAEGRAAVHAAGGLGRELVGVLGSREAGLEGFGFVGWLKLVRMC